MPQTLTYSGARLPTTTEADTVPADLLRFGFDIDQMLVLKATSQADRDARFANVTASTLVSCAALGTVWQKKADGAAGGWRTLLQSSDPVTSGVVTAASGWTVVSQWAKYTGGFYAVVCTLQYNGAADIVADGPADAVPGNITDKQIATLAAPFPIVTRPGVARATVTGCSVYIRSTDGAVFLTDLATAGRIRVADQVMFTDAYPI